MVQHVALIKAVAKNTIGTLIVFFVVACSMQAEGGAASPQELMDKAVKSLTEDDFANFLKLIPPDDQREFVTQQVSLAMLPLLQLNRMFPSEDLAFTLDDFARDLNLDEHDQSTPGAITLPENADLEHAFIAAMRLQQGARVIEKNEKGTVVNKLVKFKETNLYYLVAATDIKIKMDNVNASTAIVTFPLIRQGTEKTLNVHMVQKNDVWYLRMSPPVWPWN